MGLLQAQDQEDIGPFEVQTLMDYIGATAEYEAHRLARSLKPEQLTALVDKCAQHPAIMAASDRGGRQRKGVTREDVQTALAAASGDSRGTPRSRRVHFFGKGAGEVSPGLAPTFWGIRKKTTLTRRLSSAHALGYWRTYFVMAEKP